MPQHEPSFPLQEPLSFQIKLPRLFWASRLRCTYTEEEFSIENSILTVGAGTKLPSLERARTTTAVG